MKTWWVGVIGAVLVIGAIVVTGFGIAQARGGYGPWAYQQPATSQQTPYGPGAMMGPNGGYGPNGMMGPGGMMGGYGAQQQSPSSAAPVTGNVVAIRAFAFHPMNLRVPVGTTVTWTNYDSAPHTVTFNDSSIKSSATLNQGESYSYTFTKAGTFTYYCDVHESMVGQVVVTA